MILQTFYKTFARKYIIICFTHLLQNLQTVQTLRALQNIQTFSLQTFYKQCTNFLLKGIESFVLQTFQPLQILTNLLQTFCSKL